jgi:hypothetical protein
LVLPYSGAELSKDYLFVEDEVSKYFQNVKCIPIYTA